jgi:hypothetical protein
MNARTRTARQDVFQNNFQNDFQNDYFSSSSSSWHTIRRYSIWIALGGQMDSTPASIRIAGYYWYYYDTETCRYIE